MEVKGLDDPGTSEAPTLMNPARYTAWSADSMVPGISVKSLGSIRLESKDMVDFMTPLEFIILMSETFRAPSPWTFSLFYKMFAYF